MHIQASIVVVFLHGGSYVAGPVMSHRFDEGWAIRREGAAAESVGRG